MNSSSEHYVIEPGQTWKVDRFRPEDARGVSRLFLSVYGKGYPIKMYLQPKRLIEENAAGRTISCVAKTPQGDIVGHVALFNSAPYNRIYESGAGLVHSSYRGGKGIFTAMSVYLHDVAAKTYAVEAIYGESVCNHVFSQKLCHSLGYTTTAVEVDLMPASAYEQEKSAPGRVASLLDFKTLRPTPHPVYLPIIYQEQLRFMYRDLDDERQIFLSEKEIPAHLTTKIQAQIFDFARVARLAVSEAGGDFALVIAEEEKKLIKKGIIIIQIWLNLSWLWVGKVVEVLRKKGYFLGGILPRWFDHDGILMQKTLKEPDWEGLQIHFDRAKQIVEMIKTDWSQTKIPKHGL